MEYRLKVFVAVADSLSFTRAAHELYISQPAVTRHIKELETQLDVRLFTRNGSRISLTPAGEVLLNYAYKMAHLDEGLQGALGHIRKSYNGTLNIGASSTIHQYVLPELIAAFLKQYPQIRLNIVNGNSQQMELLLRDQKIDLALVENFGSRADLHYTSFMHDEIVAVCGRQSSYANTKFIDAELLSSLPLVVREIGSGTLEVMEEAFKRNKIDVATLRVVVHLGSTEAIKGFLVQYDAVGFISQRAVEKELQWGLLKNIPLRAFSIQREFRLVQTVNNQEGLAQLFLSFCLNYNKML